MLSIRVNRCSGKPECKSEQEINDFADKSMLAVITNDQVYNPSEYGDKTIANKLKKTFIPIDSRAKPHLKVQELVK